MHSLKEKNVVYMLAGNFLTAAAVAFFIAPNGIIMGGATGISLVLSHYLPFALPLSVLVLLVNGALFLLGLIGMGAGFALTTVANTLLYPCMMYVMESLYRTPLTEDTMLAAVCGGVLMGGGIGLILRTGGSSGGTDILALLLQHRFHGNLSALLYLIDGVVLGAQMLFSDTEQILFGLFTLAVTTMTMHRLMLMGKTQVQIMVISDKTDELREALLEKEDVGATLFLIERAFTGKAGKGIMCVLPRRKQYAVSRRISELDPQAFITISEVNEVRGRGFTYAMR